MHLFRLLALVCFLSAPFALQAQREKLPPEDLEIVEKTWPTARRTSTGLRTLVLKEGTGDQPKKGDVVSVVYVGKLLDGTIFDQATDPAKPFTFRVGRGQVIEGWEEGLQLTRVGERRLFIVPFELGYGTRGSLPKIPKRATLVFEVELLSIEKAQPLPSTLAPSAKAK
ncbi:MAG TPA: FKBP-type peptidyl-prolyl cis-trans isomerase [Opitutaceae bacterium]|nr:FKBP-type peptidyl-prolyl cis-trans isomerase [Opitutaceae bacterium]